MQNEQHRSDGLNANDANEAVAILTERWPGATVKTGETEDGAVYAMATREARFGRAFETRTVCQERDVHAVLDTDGAVVAAGTFEEVLRVV